MDLLEVVRVIGCNVQSSRGQERAIQGIQEIRREKPPPVMAPLWPGVREKHVEGADAQWREHELNGVRGLDPEETDVLDASPDGLAVDLAKAPQQAFDSQEVDFGVRCRSCQQKTALTAPDVDLQRFGGVENLRQWKFPRPTRRGDDRGGWLHEPESGNRMPCPQTRDRLPYLNSREKNPPPLLLQSILLSM